MEAVVKEQRGKLVKAGFDPEAFAQLQHSLRKAEVSWHSMQDRVDSLRAQLGGVDFNYSDPYRTKRVSGDMCFRCFWQEL